MSRMEVIHVNHSHFSLVLVSVQCQTCAIRAYMMHTFDVSHYQVVPLTLTVMWALDLEQLVCRAQWL